MALSSPKRGFLAHSASSESDLLNLLTKGKYTRENEKQTGLFVKYCFKWATSLGFLGRRHGPCTAPEAVGVAFGLAGVVARCHEKMRAVVRSAAAGRLAYNYTGPVFTAGAIR